MPVNGGRGPSRSRPPFSFCAKPIRGRRHLKELTAELFRSVRMKKIISHEFAVFLQPGALIAMFLVLLALGLGDAAIAIAARGWPF
jgi:hypothetical protein